MRGYYETTIRYYNQIANKTVKELYLVEALSFTEAEANVTKYLEDKEVKGFDVTAMKKNKYEELVYRMQEEEHGFYEAKVKIKYEDTKETTYKFLVAGLSVEDATRQVEQFVKDSEGKPNVIQVKHRDIEDLVMVKDCKENGGIIIGFEEQRNLEERMLDENR